jgi:homoserine kinase
MTTYARAEAFAPATAANLGVGFDIMGLALCEPGDVVRVELAGTGGNGPNVRVVGIEGDGGRLTYDAAKNTAAIAANEVLKTLGVRHSIDMWLQKGLPLGSGLGSSAASAVAGAVAVNALFGEPLSRAELLPAAMEGEAAVSGYHADNIAPCLFGGITLISGISADQIYQLPVPKHLVLALVTPDVEVLTADARAVLPKMVSMKAMIAQTAAVARLVDALHRGDIATMASAMECDCIIEPARAHLMPMLSEVRAAAKGVGALGVVISGAGPTLCAVCDDEAVAQDVAEAMRAVYDKAGIGATACATHVAAEGVGAQVLKVE